ncbi:MAG: copper-binding protein [Actinobacteria bacterium]|nr:copper-binding protein [Actinomycetota bacterium]
MADPSLDPGTGDDTNGVRIDRGSMTGMPRWVKVISIVALAVVLLFVLLLLTGGGHGPGRHRTEGCGDAGAPADSEQAVRTVEVSTLDAMIFEPSSISISAGETVTSAPTNPGRAVHGSTLGNAAMQQEHAEAMGQMPTEMAHDMPNSITLQPGETKELTWRFGDAATLEYACHQLNHYQARPRGEITIA